MPILSAPHGVIDFDVRALWSDGFLSIVVGHLTDIVCERVLFFMVGIMDLFYLHFSCIVDVCEYWSN